MEGYATGKPPRARRELSSGQGRQRGDHNGTGNGGRRKHADRAQVRAEEAGKQRGRAAAILKVEGALHWERMCGAGELIGIQL